VRQIMRSAHGGIEIVEVRDHNSLAGIIFMSQWEN
jgi:hypothetical protein